MKSGESPGGGGGGARSVGGYESLMRGVRRGFVWRELELEVEVGG